MSYEWQICVKMISTRVKMGHAVTAALRVSQHLRVSFTFSLCLTNVSRCYIYFTLFIVHQDTMYKLNVVPHNGQSVTVVHEGTTQQQQITCQNVRSARRVLKVSQRHAQTALYMCTQNTETQVHPLLPLLQGNSRCIAVFLLLFIYNRL